MFPDFEPDNDNHHYVPQFLLRNFAIAGSKKAIAMILLKRNQYVPKTAIAKMASESGFYGFKEYEVKLSEVEERANRIIDRIEVTRTLPVPKSDEHQELLQFILLQRSRTMAALAQRRSLIKKMVEIEIAGNPGLAGSLPEVIEKSGSTSIFQTITEQIDMMPIILDLKMVLLINESPFTFIISDNPVVSYNQYCYVVQKKYCATGLALKGLQIYFPLSPNICIMLYDDFAYRVGNGENQVTLNESDVHKVNCLQAANALSCIYSDGRIPSELFKEYAKKNTGYFAGCSAQLQDVEMRSQAGGDQMIEASLMPIITDVVFEHVHFHPDCALYFYLGGPRPNKLIPLFQEYLHARYHKGWVRNGFGDWYGKNVQKC